jgi:hypothetical protein
MSGLKLIGILGKSRVGKDTLATILANDLGYAIHRLSMPVKDACHKLFNIPRDDLESDAKEVVDPRYEKTPRDLLVWLTNAVQRDFPPEFFVERMLSECSEKGIIIPDVRFERDVNLLRKHGAVIIKVTRVDAPVCHEHESSIDALHGDFLLENNSTLYDFEKKAYTIAACLCDERSWGDGDFGRHR